MNHNNRVYAAAFAKYLQSKVKLDELEKMTADLDRELQDSQSIMTEIKTIFSSIPNEENRRARPVTDFSDDDITQYLESSVPKLILPDMSENNADLDIDDIIATMKAYAEELRNILHSHQGGGEQFEKREIDCMDLAPYVSSLEQMNKNLSNVKITADASDTNTELEEKVALLCQDVQMFTQMVQAKEKMGDTNQNWNNVQVDNSTLSYDNIISKMLSDINEVTYLLKNKK